MTEKNDYSHDTGAIRDVANDDMATIANDIEDARLLFHDTDWPALEAFGGRTFAALSEKWNTAGSGIFRGMWASQKRVEEAVAVLRQNADNYDAAEVRNVANFDEVLRLINER